MRESDVCEGACLILANKAIEHLGVRLDTELAVNFKTGRERDIGPFLKVHWTDKPKRGKRLPLVTTRCCPWCGKLMSKPKKEVKQKTSDWGDLLDEQGIGGKV
jgi:hypothetical protein